MSPQVAALALPTRAAARRSFENILRKKKRKKEKKEKKEKKKKEKDKND
jgi:hypothetical protein